jgi:type IX secretion system PorP/SprF family membrane protein
MTRTFYATLLGIGLSASAALAQQDPQFSLYMFNPVYYNPAAAGSEGVTRVQLMHRTQWTGYQGSFDAGGSPSTQLLTINAPLDKIRSGVGLYVMNDQFGAGGPQINQAVQLSYAYRLPVKSGTLAIGVQAGLYVKAIDYGVFRPREPGDELLPNQGRVAQAQPDFGLGVYYNTTDYWIGASMLHLNEAPYRLGSAFGVNPNVRVSYLTAGYRLGVGYDIDVQPSVLVKTDFNSYSVEGGLLFYYQSQYWAGVSYRQQDAFIGTIGASLLRNNALRIGFAFDFTTNGKAAKTGSSQEVLLSYNLPAPNAKKRPVVRTPRFRY